MVFVLGTFFLTRFLSENLNFAKYKFKNFGRKFLVCLALTLFETRNYSTLEYFVLPKTFKDFLHKISLLNRKRHNSIEQKEKTRGALKQKCF